MRIIIKLLFVSCFLFSVLSCKKGPGEGGLATISGKVVESRYSKDFRYLVSKYPAADESVYIMYGDDVTYNDRVTTNYDGTYELKFLRKGEYTIYVYSDDSVEKAMNNQVIISKGVSVSKKKEVIEMENFSILQEDDIEGNSSISGKVFLINYDGNTTTVLEQYYPPDYTVYIVYEDNDSYFERVNTYYDGTFVFNNLGLGIYTLYTYSDDVSGISPSGSITISKVVEIKTMNEKIVIPDLIVYD